MREGETLYETYGPFLEQIRARIFRVAVIFALTFVLGLFSAHVFFPFLVTFFSVPGVTIVATSPFQLLQLTMSAGFLTAIIFTIPYAFLQTYSFLRDGLLPKERRLIFLLIPSSIFLFAGGFAYGSAVMYFAIGLIAQVNVGFGITNLWDISQFISQLLITSALLGVIFEFPLILTVLIQLGLCTTRFLRQNRRLAYAGILVFVALLPPTDGLSFMVMSLPLVALYEVTIFVNSFGRRKELLEI